MLDCGRLTERDEHRTSNVQHRILNGIKETRLSSWKKAPKNAQYSFPGKDGIFAIPLVHYSPAKGRDERSESSSISVMIIKMAEKRRK